MRFPYDLFLREMEGTPKVPIRSIMLFRSQSVGCWMLAVSGLAVSVCGCSGETGPQLVPVSGVVTVDGQPYARAGVSFRPDDAKGNKFAQYIPAGYTNESGRYELTTTARKGAPAGWYKVVVVPPSAPPGGEMPKLTAPPFHKKYADPTLTDLSVEVKSGATSGSYDFKLSK